jgi:ABC-2 type transport system ATP-binding protein
VAVLHGGRVVAQGTPDELKAVHDAGSLDDVFLALTEPPAEDHPGTDTATTSPKEDVR